MTETKTTSGQVATGREESRHHLLVLGCGSNFSGDDQAGLIFIQRLQARGSCSCELRPMPQAGVALLEIFSQTDMLMVVDAVASGSPPGTLHLVPLPWPGIESRGLSALSGHGWGLKEVLDLAHALGRPIPRLMLLGIEVDSVALGTTLSPAVEQAVALAVERFGHIEAMVRNPEATPWHTARRFLPGDASFPGQLPDGAARK